MAKVAPRQEHHRTWHRVTPRVTVTKPGGQTPRPERAAPAAKVLGAGAGANEAISPL